MADLNRTQIDALRALLPTGALVTLNYDDCEPEPITGHKKTRLDSPQVRLGSRWYYLYQLRGGRELLEQWRTKTYGLQTLEKTQT